MEGLHAVYVTRRRPLYTFSGLLGKNLDLIKADA